MVINSNIGGSGGGSAGFSGTANISWLGSHMGVDMAYLNESMQLVETDNTYSPPTNIPVPQIIYISAPGKNETMDLSGNYDLILITSYPAGRVIYVTGDITITSR